MGVHSGALGWTQPWCQPDGRCHKGWVPRSRPSGGGGDGATGERASIATSACEPRSAFCLSAVSCVGPSSVRPAGAQAVPCGHTIDGGRRRERPTSHSMSRASLCPSCYFWHPRAHLTLSLLGSKLTKPPPCPHPHFFRQQSLCSSRHICSLVGLCFTVFLASFVFYAPFEHRTDWGL